VNHTTAEEGKEIRVWAEHDECLSTTTGCLPSFSHFDCIPAVSNFLLAKEFLTFASWGLSVCYIDFLVLTVCWV
jgi:hypothetical protein